MDFEKAISKKVYLEITSPTQEDNRSDKRRIIDALEAMEDYSNVVMPYRILKKICPLCRDAEWKITVTAVYEKDCFEIVNVEAGDTTAHNYGLCVDLGSTTVVMQLIDIVTGKVLAKESEYNRQIAYGEDILTRIFYTKDSSEKRKELQKVTIETFVKIMTTITEKTGIDCSKCSIMVLSGNTTMVHFLLGLDTFGVFSSPYAPVCTDPGFMLAAEIGIPIDGVLYCYPSKANYLGGDIISGMIAMKIPQEEDICAFIDIGTNGELVIGDKDFLIAGAGAAGPALEGGVIKTGMRAVNGAVEYVLIQNGEFKCKTINNEKAVGICGSGIVDMIAQLFLNGWIDITGKFIPEKSDKIIEINGEYAAIYMQGKDTKSGKPLLFYQSDIEQLIITKSAAHTMVSYLLNEVGMSVDMLDKFYIAGAFGIYLNPESAVTIGLYPDLPREKLICAENSSLKGAYALIMDRTNLIMIDEVLDKMEYIQFGAVSNFVEEMAAAKALPHTNIDNYPTVKEELKKRGIYL